MLIGDARCADHNGRARTALAVPAALVAGGLGHGRRMWLPSRSSPIDGEAAGTLHHSTRSEHVPQKLATPQNHEIASVLLAASYENTPPTSACKFTAAVGWKLSSASDAHTSQRSSACATSAQIQSRAKTG